MYPSHPTVDPELKAEFQEQQRKTLAGRAQSGDNPLSNFDMAGFLSGAGTKGPAITPGQGGAEKGKRK